MSYTYIILTAEQEATISNWMSKLTEENFGEMVNSPIIETSEDGSKTFKKEFNKYGRNRIPKNHKKGKLLDE